MQTVRPCKPRRTIFPEGRHSEQIQGQPGLHCFKKCDFALNSQIYFALLKQCATRRLNLMIEPVGDLILCVPSQVDPYRQGSGPPLKIQLTI
jgi:hypothetical protein